MCRSDALNLSQILCPIPYKSCLVACERERAGNPLYLALIAMTETKTAVTL
jgi:hypothetical protein